MSRKLTRAVKDISYIVRTFDEDIVTTRKRIEDHLGLIHRNSNEAENAFGIGVRRYFDTSLKQDQGYGWRVVANTQNYIAIYKQPIAILPGGSTAFNPQNSWHTYRIEVRGSDITIFIDKKLILHVIDGSFTHSGKVEIWEEFDQVVVHSFIISQL